MKLSSKALLLVFSLLLLWAPAWPQSGALVTGQLIPLGQPGEKGEAYSAVRETETIQTLGDGTHITRKTRVEFYQDLLGRTRQEMVTIDPADGSLNPQNIIISDPIDGVNYYLNPFTHMGTMNRIPPPKYLPSPPKPPINPPPAPPRRPSASLMSTTQTEDLGTQMIEGVWAKGSRMTTTVPVNVQGNDRPLTRVYERWFSEELNTTVLIKRSDPQNGETTERLTKIDRSEPDPSLFVPPADYTITEPQRP
jgi:hypothetical protein